MGFKDGTENIRSEEGPVMDEYVWVSGRDGPSWLAGGSYLITRRIKIVFDVWDSTTLEGQQQAIGREKVSGAPLGATREYDPLDLSLQAFKPTGGQTCTSPPSPSAELQDYELAYKSGSTETAELQKLTDKKAGTQTLYAYNVLNQLKGAVTEPVGGGTASLTSVYKYDEAGNLVLNHTHSPTTTYTDQYYRYNAANEICKIATTEPAACPSPEVIEEDIAGEPTYDKDGDMTSDGALGGPAKFAYTVRDQLSSITPHGGTAKQIVSHGTGQEDLAAIGSEEVIQNVLGVGVTGSGESAHYYTRDQNGVLLAKRTAKKTPSETQYYLRDPFGSVAKLLNSSGSQVAPKAGSYQYDPYGASIGATPATFGYRVGAVLPAGLAHFGARYYDPGVAVWTQRDPNTSPASLTGAARFSYSDDDPVSKADPSGRSVGDYVHKCTSGAVTGAIADEEDPVSERQQVVASVSRAKRLRNSDAIAVRKPSR
jgi:RHS repeat-associated protein